MRNEPILPFSRNIFFIAKRGSPDRLFRDESIQLSQRMIQYSKILTLPHYR